MAVVQPVPDDEIAAELAAAWSPGDPDAPAPAGPGDRAPHRPGPATAPLARRRPGDPADVAEAADRVRPVAMAHEQVLPVAPAFAGLLPGGLPRGSVVGVGAGGPVGNPADPWAPGAATVALALAGGASQAGSWTVAVGLPALGLAAAAEAGIALDRLVVVDPPPPEQWATVVGALVGAFDVILLGPPAAGLLGRHAAGLLGPPAAVRAADGRRLAARARERGSVLIQLAGAAVGAAGTPALVREVPEGPGGPMDGRRAVRPPVEVDLWVTVAGVAWQGLASGHGHLRARRVQVEVGGRRAAARVRRAELWLPDERGQIRLAAERPVAVAPVAPMVPAERDPDERVGSAVAAGGGALEQARSDLEAVRRERLRRAARQPVVPEGRPAATTAVWSDAG